VQKSTGAEAWLNFAFGEIQQSAQESKIEICSIAVHLRLSIFKNGTSLAYGMA